MVNCDSSMAQICGLLKKVREMEANNNIPIITKTRYMANLPTTRLTASTYRT